MRTGVLAPTTYPRADLVAAFLNGVPNVNVLSRRCYEALRLNTAVPADAARRRRTPLGAATCFDPPADNAHGPTLNLARTGCDPAGFPNGRRPGDDTVDIALRVAMGFLLDQDHAPIRGAPLVDGAAVDARDFQTAFPYLTRRSRGRREGSALVLASSRLAACGDDRDHGRCPTQEPSDARRDGRRCGWTRRAPR